MPFPMIKAVCFSVTYKAVQSFFSLQRYNCFLDKSNKNWYIITTLTIFYTRV